MVKMNVNLKEEIGNWERGYSLDYQVLSSKYLGNDENGRALFDTTRTDVGESVYQLKYKEDFSQVPILAGAIEHHLLKKYGDFHYIVPMPPSKHRPRQPVFEVSKQIASSLNIAYCDNLLYKNTGAKQMKDKAEKNEKIKLLTSFLGINDVFDNNGPYDILLLDDLISSGASLEVACSLLNAYNKIDKVFVAVLTRTKNR